MRDPNAVILFGGASDEARVSVASAQNVARTLVGARLWFWALGGEVFELSRPELDAHENPFTSDFNPQGDPRFSSLEDAVGELA
ncbi:MAG: hypothetical protein KDD51_15375, partial [Bdellovibrionales bacterium]|nr:hypothetical protein [Bdellovibrionales bacterium]